MAGFGVTTEAIDVTSPGGLIFAHTVRRDLAGNGLAPPTDSTAGRAANGSVSRPRRGFPTTMWARWSRILTGDFGIGPRRGGLMRLSRTGFDPALLECLGYRLFRCLCNGAHGYLLEGIEPASQSGGDCRCAGRGTPILARGRAPHCLFLERAGRATSLAPLHAHSNSAAVSKALRQGLI